MTKITTYFTKERIAGLLLAGIFTFFVPAISILGAAINWPESLDFEAARSMTLIHSKPSEVFLGYSMYFISSVFILLSAMAIPQIFKSDSFFLKNSTFLGFTAGTLKLVGLSRWLLVMPYLASEFSKSDSQRKAILAEVYNALNKFAGNTIGEILGNSVFSGLWILFLSIFFIKKGTNYRYIGLVGLLVALGLFFQTYSEFNPSELPVIAITTTASLFWYLILGVAIFLKKNEN